MRPESFEFGIAPVELLALLAPHDGYTKHLV
jgi:hypothetical protein